MTTLLKDLPKENLPRERLVSYGPESLSNEELISIILRTGTKGHSVKDLSNEILASTKTLADLKNLTINKLKLIRGLGEVKSITLIAALELGKRVFLMEEVPEKLKINCSVDAYRYFAHLINDKKQEHFLAIYLDCHSICISKRIVFTGTINESIVHPREVFRGAIEESATSIILMHNHPSGDTTPSKADDLTTKNFLETGVTIGIKVVDHIIVGKDNYYSYLEEGRIKYEQ